MRVKVISLHLIFTQHWDIDFERVVNIGISIVKWELPVIYSRRFIRQYASMYVAISYICAPCALYSLLVRYASVSYAFIVRSMWLVRCASVSYKFGIRRAFVEHSSSMRSMRSSNVAHSYCYNVIMPYSLSIRYSSVAYALCKLNMRWQIDSFTVILERIRNGLRIFAISLCVSHQLGPGTHMWPRLKEALA